MTRRTFGLIPNCFDVRDSVALLTWVVAARRERGVA